MSKSKKNTVKTAKGPSDVMRDEASFVSELRKIVESERRRAYASVNVAQLRMCWAIGERIVEREQRGKRRAEYGDYIVRLVSDDLAQHFGAGFSVPNIKNMRQFYLAFKDGELRQTLFGVAYSQIGYAARSQSGTQKGYAVRSQSPTRLLPWTHYRTLMRVEDADVREWHMNEDINEGWSYRTLERNIASQYCQRLLASQNKAPVQREMKRKTAEFQKKDPLAYIRNPIVTEFLGISQSPELLESDLESAILANMSKFLMEMGKGFAYVGRQQHIRTETNDYYIDLVFYNYILKCFVLIDLKTTKITYQDVGQMDMYLQMYDTMRRQPVDNPTIGIIVCSETDQDVARFSTLAKNDKMFASQYKLYLPSKKELKKEIDRQKEIFFSSHPNGECLTTKAEGQEEPVPARRRGAAQRAEAACPASDDDEELE